MWAQTGPFRSRIDIVQVTVAVTDAGGRLITGLTQEDFQVFEDGVEQTITQFTDKRVPVSLGMLLDASDSMRGQPIVDARDALDRFVGELLLGEDEALVATFAHALHRCFFFATDGTQSDLTFVADHVRVGVQRFP